jgi:DNA-binding NarL/FixJ family response regulator
LTKLAFLATKSTVGVGVNSPIKVLVVDDHEVVRFGIGHTLSRDSRVQIIGEAFNGKHALELIQSLKPDVVLLDISMPELDGFGVLDEIQKRGISSKIVFLTMHLEDRMIERALSKNVDGYILKSLPKEEIVECIVKVAAGQRSFHPVIFKTLGERYASYQTKPKDNADVLTRRELEILKFIVDGLTSAQIGTKLFISPRTVDTHRSNMMQKLNITNTASLVRFALDSNILNKVKDYV